MDDSENQNITHENDKENNESIKKTEDTEIINNEEFNDKIDLTKPSNTENTEIETTEEEKLINTEDSNNNNEINNNISQPIKVEITNNQESLTNEVIESIYKMIIIFFLNYIFNELYYK